MAGAGLVIGAESILRYRKIDTNHSTVGFVVPILGGMSEVHGRFTDFTVEIDVPAPAVGSGTAEAGDAGTSPPIPAPTRILAVIRTASIDTGIDERDHHLRSDDFFASEEHPEIRFESSAITRSESRYVAEGTLTVRGISKPFRLPFRSTGLRRSDSGKVMLGFAADVTLDRREFGIEWMHPDPAFVGTDVRVVLRILTKLKSPEEAG